ncbi:MAG: hypothetical protein ACRD2L_14250 [Terriglobia bacterium]
MRTDFAVIHAAVWAFGGILLATGFVFSGNDMTWLAALVGQAGIPNPRLVEKLHLVPLLIVVTGTELLLLAVSLSFVRRRALSWADRAPWLGSTQLGMCLLLGGWTAIALLSLNFGAISLVNRLKHSQGLTAAELLASDFGDDYRVVRAVRDKTPEFAAILIKTQRPLQFLLNYELYPRRFYFYPDRGIPVASVPEAWLDQRHIGWTLEISDTGPLHFNLASRKASY